MIHLNTVSFIFVYTTLIVTYVSSQVSSVRQVSLQSCVYNMGQCQVRLLEVKASGTARRRSQQSLGIANGVDSTIVWPVNVIGHWANPLCPPAKWHNHNKSWLQ
jgi:hypothetical protein